MSLMPPAMQVRRPIKHFLTMIGLALFTIALQVALPWISYSVAVHFDRAAWGKTETWDQFWVDRFRFYWLFKPALLEPRLLRFQSATACGDELVVLFATSKAKDADECCPMLRCNLKTGANIQSLAEPGIRYVVSDGQKIWWLPAYSHQISPFVWEGRPVALVGSKFAKSPIRMVEFVGGQWREADQFLIKPNAIDSLVDSLVRVLPINGRAVAIKDLVTQFSYRADLEFGPQEASTSNRGVVAKAFSLMNRSDAMDPGWTKCIDNSGVVIQHPRRHMIFVKQRDLYPRTFTHLWFDQKQLWGLRSAVEVQLRAPISKSQLGYVCENLESADNDHYFVSSPLRWELDEVSTFGQVKVSTMMNVTNKTVGRQSSIGDSHVVTGQGNDVYILNLNRMDGRIAVMRLVDRQARLIAEIAEPINWRGYLDAFFALMMVFVIPTMILVMIATFIQRGASSERKIRDGAVVELASIVRRSIARGIDSVLLGGGLCASMILNPGLLAWWLFVLRAFDTLQAKDFRTVAAIRGNLQAILRSFSECFVIPLEWRWFSIVCVLFVLQVIWEGRTGYTLGKWLVGIRTLRTTYRPCGIARSLLRELLLIPESLGLLSWWPAVIAILSTADRQRVGDLLADTVVIRARSIASTNKRPDVENPAAPVSS